MHIDIVVIKIISLSIAAKQVGMGQVGMAAFLLLIRAYIHKKAIHASIKTPKPTNNIKVLTFIYIPPTR